MFSWWETAIGRISSIGLPNSASASAPVEKEPEMSGGFVYQPQNSL